MRNLSNRKGVAIITAMLMVVLVVTLASSALWGQDIQTRRTENAILKAKADAVARSAIDWIGSIIKEDSQYLTGWRIGERGPEDIRPFKVDNGNMAGLIIDEQGKFNLNNLVRGGEASPHDDAIFKRLLTNLKLSTDLADSVADWIDIDQEPLFPGGAEDHYYLGLNPSYRAANKYMADINELYWIKGFDENAVETLRPYVTALPQPAPVNTNSASAMVIASIYDGLSIEEAEAIVNIRKNSRFEKASDFLDLLPKAVKDVKTQDITVSSRYYMGTAKSRFGHVRGLCEALFEVNEGVRWPRIVWMKSA